MQRKTARTCAQILVVLAVTLMLAGMAGAGTQGAIFTTTQTGTTVNGNIYDSKAAVYISGGPQNTKSQGLPPGNYYYQVTDPSGSPLLSLDPIKCRVVVVNSDGRVDGVPSDNAGGFGDPTCYHNVGTPDQNDSGLSVQLCSASGCPSGAPPAQTPGPSYFSYYDTPNPGGEYKVWMIPVADYGTSGPLDQCHGQGSPGNCWGFVDDPSKTDNFKVKQANLAYITVCKFQACTLSDDTGTCNGNADPLLPGWTIDATGADQASQVTAGFGTTSFGCTTFTVSHFTNDSADVGLSEVLQSGWQQTAPDGNTPGATPGSACSATGTVPNADANAGETCTVHPGDNIAAANFGNVQVEQGTGPAVTKTAHGSYNTTYTWQVSKSVDQTKQFTAGGGPATFNYTVSVTHDGGTTGNVMVTGDITLTNPNPFDITIADVTDSLSDGTVCTVTGGGVGANVSVPANSNVDLLYKCSLGAVPTTEEDNTVVINWADQTGTLNGVPWELTAGTANFTVSKISFSNAVIDGSVTVSDSLQGSLGTVSFTDPSPKTFTYPLTFNDPAGTCTSHTNTVTITTSDTQSSSSASQTVTDCQGANLTVSKTAATAYNSNITKSVDKTRVEISGGTATFNYTVNVTTSGWGVTGTITVSNPNDWESISANLSDALSDSGGVCTVTPASVSVPASGSATAAYSCTFAKVPSAGSGTNTATATWDSSAAHTTNNSAKGTASYAFASLTVTDCFSAKGTTCTPNTLGTVTIPPGSATFTYSRTVNAPPGGTCQEYDNTATITQTGQTASAAVTVCNTKTGALTMGFWQNKNGQGIITGSHATAGVCDVGTWLRQYAPFQDLSATASCSAVATYVFNIIKAANAGGASMNAMLKAQMLATALDVYFSDPTLGGNKIGAAGPLGGVKIDLTKVCVMIDSSGGTASCSGSTENCAAAFGGTPTCQTVSALLAYAASQSNVGGSLWYGQVKATQGLAKNTFDAINNQAAFICP